MKNILILSTYPISDPKHGGQLRVRNIVNNYFAAGFSVEVAGILGSASYKSEQGFLPFPGNAMLRAIYEETFLMEDYAIGKLFSEDDAYFSRLSKSIKSKPDIIQVEHPWMMGFALRFAATAEINPLIVYSSHNVEHELKRKILSSYVSEDKSSSASLLVKEIEIAAIEAADAIVCVSANDCEWVRSYTSNPVLLAPNGVADWDFMPDKSWDMDAKTIVGKNQGYALFCASGHPPNVTGFFDMFGGGFGSLNPDQSLVIAGGAGLSIVRDERIQSSVKLLDRVKAPGLVSQKCLESLINHSHALVLPITVGGGTNLKTAEALWSGKHIVATSLAMRGFEEFIGEAGVCVADSASEFKQMLRKIMNSPPLVLSEDQRGRRKKVLWENCLRGLVEFIKEQTTNKNIKRSN